ncbi:hypothetical protein OG21DRAFT_1515448 [Imleria badia]|nr:hypothetical protein OG21DRAFT_1515448 [Imleria badia]
MLPQDEDTIRLPPGDGAAQPTKKRRGGRSDAPRKRRRGNPAELCQLNLDVLFIIATCIHPLDLLNLARTCKSLRILLMDRASEFIWRAARRQFEDLPDCPDDLSEPAYANLAFYARCHACDKHTTAVFWRIRRRYCTECRDERYDSQYVYSQALH